MNISYDAVRFMRDEQGLGFREIGARLGASHTIVHRVYTRQKSTRAVLGAPVTKDVSYEDVRRMRDEEKLTFREIGYRLGVASTTVWKVYARKGDGRTRNGEMTIGRAAFKPVTKEPVRPDVIVKHMPVAVTTANGGTETIAISLPRVRWLERPMP